VLKDAEEGEVTDEDEAAEMPDNEISKIKKKSKVKLSKELSNCVIICQSVSFKSFEESRQKCK